MDSFCLFKFVSKLHIMQYLHLDSQFQPFGNSIQFECFTFSGGELHIRINTTELSDELTITTRPRSFNDMGMILLAADAAKRAGVLRLHLIIPYFPAARQDRLMVVGEPLSVKVYADLINSVGFQSVTVFDPHSDVTPALIDNVKVIPNYGFVEEAIKGLSTYHLISPDGGALKKVHKLAMNIGAQTVIECSKMRDVRTGKLSGFTVYADDLEGKTCIVVDDICDGGGTFLGLADELKAKNAGDLILITSHGIFSKGVDELCKKYTRIVCTNSFGDVDDPRIQVIKLTKELIK